MVETKRTRVSSVLKVGQMRCWLSLALAMALASCAHDPSSDTEDASYHRVIGEGLDVVVVNADRPEDGAVLAGKYCSQYGRVARFKERTQVSRARTTSLAVRYSCE